MNTIRTIGPLSKIKDWAKVAINTALYVHVYKVNAKPGVITSWTQETEAPYRYGKCLLITVPGYAIGIGRWLYERSEDDALMASVQGRVLDVSEEE